MGLHRAWPDAEILGVDIKPQPRYPFKFVQADAMTFPLEGYDFIWASPPCQAFSKTRAITRKNYPDLIDPIRQRIQIGVPYVIENVVGAPLFDPILLCGTMFGLKVIRHRNFETNFPVLTPQCGRHGGTKSHRGYSRDAEFICVAGHNFSVSQAKIAMGIDWMTGIELAQAVPPAYSQFLARQARSILA